jgi:hypothetical protein
MFNSTILDVSIGIIFVYLLLSLICSAANEAIEIFLKKRSTDLERGVRELLGINKASKSELVKNLYNHPLINALFLGDYENSRIRTKWRYIVGTKLPSYIPARNFSLALMDLIMRGKSTADVKSEAKTAIPATSPAAEDSLSTLRSSLKNLGNPQLQQALSALIDAAGNDMATVRANIEEWFNSSMDRVSGWYKRRSQLIVLVLGFVVAIAVNADSVIIAKRLSSDRALRESLVSAADAYAKANATASPSTAKPPTSASPTNPGAGASTGSATPTPTPTPTPPPTPKPTPKPTGDACWKATDECKSDQNSLACKAKEDECRLQDCWKTSDACKEDKDSPACKLKESTCRLEALGLPIGWPNDSSGQSTWPGLRFWHPVEFVSRWYPHFRLHFFGWFLTALAISLGAPFWFDLLNKFIVVRSTVKPKEKSLEEKPK